MCDWHGRLSPWQRECWPWQMPREQLVGSGRLASKQIYRQSSTTRPPNRGGNDKKTIRVKENKERIVGRRRESAGRGGEEPFPARSARSRRERQNRLQGAVSPEIIKRWRFDAICQIWLKMSVFLQISSERTQKATSKVRDEL